MDSCGVLIIFLRVASVALGQLYDCSSDKKDMGITDHYQTTTVSCSVNTLRPRQNGCHFADDTFKRIFVNENVRLLFEISLKFVPKGPINNIPALVQIMAWRRPGDKPLSEPMMVCLPTHICITQPQWVNGCQLTITEIPTIRTRQQHVFFFIMRNPISTSKDSLTLKCAHVSPHLFPGCIFNKVFLKHMIMKNPKALMFYAKMFLLAQNFIISLQVLYWSTLHVLVSIRLHYHSCKILWNL